MSEKIAELEKSRKALHIIQIIRQVVKYAVATVLFVSFAFFLCYLLYCLYIIFIVEDKEAAVRNAPRILAWMDRTQLSGDGFLTLWIVSIIIDIVILLFYAGYSNRFRRLYKEMFVAPVISEVFEQVRYRYTEGFHEEQIRQFSLVKNGDNVLSEDYLSGSYRGVKFEQAEVIVKSGSKAALIGGNATALFFYIRNIISARTINRKSKTGKRKDRIKTYFNGQMLTFAFPRENVKSLHVFSGNYKNRPNLDAASSKVVKMENVEFNERFDVLTADAYDAFYILTPHMQERMLRLLDEFESIAFHFHGNTLYLGFNSQNDFFDTDIRKPISYPKERKKIQDDLKIIKDIIDIMLMRSDVKMDFM